MDHFILPVRIDAFPTERLIISVFDDELELYFKISRKKDRTFAGPKRVFVRIGLKFHGFMNIPVPNRFMVSY